MHRPPFRHFSYFYFFFFNDTPTTEIYTLSLHDALPILLVENFVDKVLLGELLGVFYAHTLSNFLQFGKKPDIQVVNRDRKSTRLNSSHVEISYAVFCLKKKTN